MNRFARYLQGGKFQSPVSKDILKQWIPKLNLGCAKLLVQERRSMEKNNLKWNAETKTFELPFGLTELNNYTFIDSIYLGKEKQCILNSTNEILDSDTAKIIMNNLRVSKEYTPNITSNIITLLKQTLSFETVLHHNIRNLNPN